MQKTWKKISLESIITDAFSGGTPPSGKAEFWDGDIPWTTTSPMNADDVYLGVPQRYISQAGLNNSSSKIVPAGNILFATRVGVGKAVINTIDIAINQDITAIIPDRRLITPEFLILQLKQAHIQTYLSNHKHGATIKGITRDSLKKVPLVLPPLQEQATISKVLQSILDAIDCRKEEIRIECERREALREHLFTSSFNNIAPKHTEIGKLPKNWSLVPFGEIAKAMQYGLSQKGHSTGQYPILRMNNLRDGRIDDTSLQWVDLDDKLLKKFAVQRGDILFNRTNSIEHVGRTGIANESDKYVFASYLIRIVVNEQKANPWFVSAYLNYAETQKRLKGIASRAVGQSNISASKLKMFLMPVPPLNEQAEIAELLKSLDDKIASLQAELALQEELFRFSLDRLMSGKIELPSLAEKRVA